MTVDLRHRQFLRSVDAALKPLLADDPLPLGVVGVDRYLAFWDEVSTHKEFIRASLLGNYDHASIHELRMANWTPINGSRWFCAIEAWPDGARGDSPSSVAIFTSWGDL